MHQLPSNCISDKIALLWPAALAVAMVTTLVAKSARAEIIKDYHFTMRQFAQHWLK